MADAIYTPRADTAAMLDRAWEILNSVPYAVSARWLFYRMFQEGYYSAKSDYKDKFIKVTSAARHACYKGWRPDTLPDETRSPIVRGNGATNVEQWLSWVANRLTCTLNKWEAQPNYVELWFEARAMTQQFEHYTDHVTLRPMGGAASIDYKYQTAKDLERYPGKDIYVLYFGDLDTAGVTIADVIERDVRKWCSVDFRFIWCGLTAEQAKRWDVPENFDKPGAFQWEALSDEGAADIITTAIAPYLRHDAIEEIQRQESVATDWTRKKIAELGAQWATKAA